VDWNGQENFSLSCELWVGTNDFNTKKNFLEWKLALTPTITALSYFNDHSPINPNFELNKSRQKFHHSLKEHHKISNIPMFRCEML
jgi:hypothetical protein